MAGHSARSHAHSHGVGSSIAHSRGLLAVLVATAIAVLIGLIVLWPPRLRTAHVTGQAAHGVVTASALTGCNTSCVVSVSVRLTDGPDTGKTTVLTFVPGATDPQLRVGEHIPDGALGQQLRIR